MPCPLRSTRLLLLRKLVGRPCLTFHRQRGHLETAPPFTALCEGREGRFLHRSHRTPGRRVAFYYTTAALITAPPRHFTIFSLIIAHLMIFFLTFYFIFTYYRPLDDLLALVVENKFT